MLKTDDAYRFNGLSSTRLLLALDLTLLTCDKEPDMLRISAIDTQFLRRLILEGNLVEPWLGELREICRNAHETLKGRKLAIDFTDVTVIGCEAESTLSELIQTGAKFSCGGILVKHVLKRLARKCRDPHKDVTPPAGSNR